MGSVLVQIRVLGLGETQARVTPAPGPQARQLRAVPGRGRPPDLAPDLGPLLCTEGPLYDSIKVETGSFSPVRVTLEQSSVVLRVGES